MAEKERKIIIEREYVVPLREEWLKVPEWKRSNKAVKALKQFMVRHMKVYDRDLRKIKVDINLNNELRFRGIRKPWHKIKVKAIKYDDGLVVVKLVELPKHIEFEMARKVRKMAELASKTSKIEKKEEEKKEETKEEKQDEKEKTESSKEAMQAEEKSKAKEAKHASAIKEPKIQRKVMMK